VTLPAEFDPMIELARKWMINLSWHQVSLTATAFPMSIFYLSRRGH
jgi:hypothetical protein